MKSYNISYQDKNSLLEFINNSTQNNINIKSTLIQVFTTQSNINFIKQLQEEINELFPSSVLAGLTVQSNLNDKIHTNISIIYFEDTSISISTTSNISSEISGNSLLSTILQDDTKVAILYTTKDVNADDFISSMSDISDDIIISGTVASAEDKSFCFTNDTIIDKFGAIGISLNSQTLKANNYYTFDWEGIGKTMTITKADKHNLYMIDDRSAYDTYKYYFGEDLASSLPSASVEFPIILKDTKKAKIITQKHNDGSLTLGGNIQVGDEIQFGFGNSEAILNSSVELANKLTHTPVQSMMMYSCAVRKSFLFNTIFKEIELFNEVACISGGFVFGSFYTDIKDKSSNRYQFLNQSLAILTLSETDETSPKELKSLRLRNRSKQTLKALSTLIDTTSLELKVSNSKLLEKQKKLKELNSNLASIIDDERKKIELQNKQLLEQSRLAQMGEMISMIAHQWRQPLTAITSTSSTLGLKIMLGKYDPDEFRTNIDNITKYAQHLSKTIDDFRDFFKTNKQKNSSTLEKIIDSSLGIVRTSIESKNITLVINYNCNQNLDTYTNELKQVILNLIKNAEDVLVDRKIENPTITVSTKYEDEAYIVEIGDNAGGIDEKIIDKIFDPYFSTKKAKDGTGLGLYMSKTIIEDHCSGNLTVCNASDGALFRITI